MLGFVKGKSTCDCLFAAEIVCSPWRYTSFPCLAGSLSSSPLLLTSVNQSVCPDDSDVTEPVRSQSSILPPSTTANCSVCSSPSFPPHLHPFGPSLLELLPSGLQNICSCLSCCLLATSYTLSFPLHFTSLCPDLVSSVRLSL